MVTITNWAYGGFFHVSLLLISYMMSFLPFTEQFEGLDIYDKAGNFLFHVSTTTVDSCRNKRKIKAEFFRAVDTALVFSHKGKYEIRACSDDLSYVESQMRILWRYCNDNNISTTDLYIDYMDRNSVIDILANEDLSNHDEGIVNMFKEAVSYSKSVSAQ